MILIVDNTHRKMRTEIRDLLLSRCVPCAVTNTDKLDAFLPATVIIVTEKYLYEDVKYLSDMHEYSPIVVYNEKENFKEFVIAVYEEYCKNKYEAKDSRRVIFDEGRYYFCSKELFMTKTEKRIIRALLSKNGWMSAEHISYYCLKGGKEDPKSVAVHICNLNNKVFGVTRHNIISCRRYSGYRINEF